jgi:nitroreductase
MEYLELIHHRYSVRGYQPLPVEKDKLLKVLEAARLAPTACNRQPFRFYVIPTPGREVALRRIYPRPWFTEAPLLICACAIPAQGWKRRDGKNYTDVDVTIAMDHLILAAADLGLGTCWVAAFDPAAAREVLALPEDEEPIVFTPLGYPSEPIKSKVRRPLSEIVVFK